MELTRNIIKIIDVNLIFCLTPIIFTLILVRLFFKNRFQTKQALRIIAWTMITYTIFIWVDYLIGMVTASDLNEYFFLHRATGPYFAYWIMLLFALVLPLTLFHKKLASKSWYLLIVAFGLKCGVYFERYVIVITSFHRDVLSESGNYEVINLFFLGMVGVFLQGMIIAVLILGILELIKKYNTRYDKA